MTNIGEDLNKKAI